MYVIGLDVTIGAVRIDVNRLGLLGLEIVCGERNPVLNPFDTF
jgi:hypothetical protein